MNAREHQVLEGKASDASSEIAGTEHDDLSEAERLARLELGLQRIPARRRAIFLARRLEQLSYTTIAERTGLSIRQIEREIAAAIVEIDRAMSGEQRSWFSRLWSWISARLRR